MWLGRANRSKLCVLRVGVAGDVLRNDLNSIVGSNISHFYFVAPLYDITPRISGRSVKKLYLDGGHPPIDFNTGISMIPPYPYLFLFKIYYVPLT